MSLQALKPIYSLLACTFMLVVGVDAQPNYVPNVLPPSPNAASLMKFSDIPVSPYTGTADVVVPIYTIQARGLSLPISIDYHTGGIRLKEEASSVGLGWALSAGGSISRTIMDKDDFSVGFPYFTTGAPQLPGDMSEIQYPTSTQIYWNMGIYFYDMWCTYKVNTTAGTEDFYNAFTLNGGANGTAQYDMEPDIYSYHFPGHSGKFMLTRSGGVVLQKQDNIRISFEWNGNSFTILDEQGNKYYFGVKETMQSITGLPNTSATSSWNMSSIITQLNDTVAFTYGNDGTYTTTQADKYESWNMGCSPAGGDVFGNSAPNVYFNVPLQTIDFSGGQLQFIYDAHRSDLAGAKKLDTIKLYSKTPAGLVYVHSHNFNFSYFAAPGYVRPWGSDSLDQLRLRLDSVQEVSGATTLPSYAFTYNQPGQATASLLKDAFTMDHWGYYNGQNNTHLIPTSTYLYQPPIYLSSPGTLYQVTGGNREPDASSTATYTSNFSLQAIRYPTGGSTAFTYEPNDYDLTNSSIRSSTGGSVDFPQVQVATLTPTFNISTTGTTTGTIDLSKIYPILPQGSSTPNLMVDVAFLGSGNNGVLYNTQPAGKIYFKLTGPGVNYTFDITNQACQGNSNYCSSNQTMSIYYNNPALYTWTAYIDPSVSFTYFSEIHVLLSWQQMETDSTVGTTSANGGFTGGGIRIKAVTDYSAANVPVKSRKYVYDYQQTVNGTTGNYSYGRLMSQPDYARYSINPVNANNQICWSLSLFGSSLTPLSSVVQGNAVGYDQVAEYEVDPTSGQDIGKTVYTYYNSADTPISYSGLRLPGTFNMGNSLNGSLLSQTLYKNSGGSYLPVTSTVNSYHTANRIVYFSPKYNYYISGINGGEGGGPGGDLGGCIGDTTVEFEVFACFYPSLKSERVLLDSTVQTTYDQLTSANYSQQTKRYYYDNPLHYQVTRSGTVDSKGDTLVTHLKYPQDYIPNGNTVTGNTILDSLIGRNMVSETIEKQDSFYYPGSSAGYITGAQLSLFRILPSAYRTIVPDRTYKLAVNSPVTNFQPFAISGNTTSLDSRYRQMVSLDQYDANNNLQQYTPVDQNPVSFLWDYRHVYPIAQVKNAALADVAATSFEADGTGNWTYTGASTADTTAVTGSYCYNLGQSGGSISKSGLTSGTTYVLSYWLKGGGSPLTITGTLSGYPIKGKTINNWTYYEYKFTGQTSMTVSGSASIDELRLYPATAQMTTYTYAPLTGTTTACDVDNKVTYYFYDGLGRLMFVKDQDGNIIKTYLYHYLNSTTQY